jgi:DNA-binding NarL/FixJ family response regulator/signal transduction histidine kinase
MGSKTRWVLAWAMAGLLLLTAATGAAALAAFSRIHGEDAKLRSRSAENSRRLEQVRAAIYLSADDPQTASALRDQTLGYLTAPETASLRGEVVAWFRLLDLMNEMQSRRPSAGVDAWFRQQLSQRRAAMLNLSSSISAALDREWQSGQAQLDSLYARFRWTLGLELALVFALGVVVAIFTVRRTVRLEAQARALSSQLLQAQEEERRAIARELHDEVGQALSGVLLEAPTPALRSRLEDAVDTIRRISLSLRPSMLDDLGLVAALEWQAREVGNRSGLAIEVCAKEAAGELPEQHRTCIFRVAQEALRNCARHLGGHACPRRAGKSRTRRDAFDRGQWQGLSREPHARPRAARDGRAREPARRQLPPAQRARPRRHRVGGASTVTPVRVFLADDHAIVRGGLRLLLEREPGFTIAGEAADGRVAVDALARDPADVAVLDVGMPGLNGVEAAAQILRRCPEIGIVMLSMHSDETYVLRCLRAGARAYVLKESAASELIDAIRAVRAGRSYFSPKVQRLLQRDHVARLQRSNAADPYETLTEREREVLQLAAEGNSNKEIGGRLAISTFTVETHRKRIAEKLNLHGPADLILYAVRRGIVAV